MGEVIQQALTAYSWAVVGLLLAFIGRIAYFYGRTSRERVRYWLVAAPGLVMVAGAAWYSVHEIGFVGQPVGDLLLFCGGVLLIAMGSRLRDLMTGAR
jgi:hypothetical protein